jgi:hypothetical protein
MIPIQSTLTEREFEYATMKDYLQRYGFTLGGNWDYDHGSFDKQLDGEAQKVWLRIPFDVARGELDSEREGLDTLIRFGTPYVLKHLYNEGSDPEASFHTYGALLDQFQTPIDADASVEDNWVIRARQVMAEVEHSLLH